jgi:hypothetical protein
MPRFFLLVVLLISGCGLFDPDPSIPRADSWDEPAPANAMPIKTDVGTPSVEQIVQYAQSHAAVTWYGVGAPLGRVVLMRRGSDLCAIRFTAFRTAHETSPGVFTLGGPSYYAEYDWYELKQSARKSGHREASEKPGYGIPLLMDHPFSRGDHFIKCGSIEPLWSYPISVGFLETNDASRDSGIELAPTGWRDISEIDLKHPALRWYRVNGKRKPFLIPLDALPRK